jgi:hypothetical protein
MDDRVQRLYSTIQKLGKAGKLFYLDNRHVASAQGGRGTTG